MRLIRLWQCVGMRVGTLDGSEESMGSFALVSGPFKKTSHCFHRYIVSEFRGAAVNPIVTRCRGISPNAFLGLAG